MVDDGQWLLKITGWWTTDGQLFVKLWRLDLVMGKMGDHHDKPINIKKWTTIGIHAGPKNVQNG